MADPVDIEHLLSHGRPGETGVASRDGAALDFTAFAARATHWHAAFAREAGSRWALYFDDTFDFAAALLGAWHAGRCVYLPSDARPATLERLRGEVDGFAGTLPAALSPLVPVAGAPARWSPLRSDAEALVVYTSGSSGEPTAIPKRLGQLTREVSTLARLFDARVGPDARVLATVSHQHIYGLLFRVLWPLTTGRPFLARSLPYPEDIVAALEEGPAALVASPAHLKRLPESLDWTPARRHLRAVFSSGGPLPTDALHACRARLGQAPVEVYGSSETGGIAWRQRSEDDARPWTVMPGVVAEAGDDGALTVRSPHLHPPGEARFQTADHVRLVEGGFELLGRSDRLLKLEEKRVSLTAMERALAEGGLVREARVVPLQEGHRLILAVVALPSEDGWRVHAGGGKRALNQALRERLARRFEPGALPRRFRYLEAMPVNSQGKTPEAALTALFDARRPPARELERSPERVLLALEAQAESPYFRGHFPGMPILPGVAQLEWAIQLGREYFPLPPDFLRMEAVKFQQLIPPGTHLTLELTWTEAKGSLHFKLTSAAGTHAGGRIVFGGAPR
ncbi:AMP-binding protein [Myxococcus sp. K15C18031901]|uniref:AMP-binding protein n=1 Tax=Myxococcus dinghuensis TaxID=2906761 RepID=UPI0020A73C0B|nr:AMP-binding protein [Myxococcus dinghuensis]MCP3102396.1 AMP-binding protein [Myxococcus dinghuensis]